MEFELFDDSDANEVQTLSKHFQGVIAHFLVHSAPKQGLPFSLKSLFAPTYCDQQSAQAEATTSFAPWTVKIRTRGLLRTIWKRQARSSTRIQGSPPSIFSGAASMNIHVVQVLI